MKGDPGRGGGLVPRIVAGVDGSASSRRALVWAARFALATNAEISRSTPWTRRPS